MTAQFSGKTILVTGAAKGIGRAIAEGFAARGGRVVGVDVDLPEGRTLGERSGEGVAGTLAGRTAMEAIYWERGDGDLPAEIASGSVTWVRADVADETQITEALKAVGPTLHVLVNNAGLSWFGPLETEPLERFDRVLAVNLRGPYLLSRIAAPLLRAAGEAAIINITSTRAFQSEPGSEAYAAAKGGLTALTHALALSLGPAVRVNAVAPGWIETTGAPLSELDHAQHPVGRVGRPVDVAQACLYLADPAQSGFMTGQTLVLDGGMTRKMIYE